MKILGLESSGLVAGVAVVEDGILLAEYNVNYKKTHSQTLLPMLDEVRRMLELDMDTIDAIAVASGPGSFTGLRIGSATAKGLGLALDKPIVEVPTLEGLAYNLCGTQAKVCPLMDARRNQVYTAIYEFVQPYADTLLDKQGVPLGRRSTPLDKTARLSDGEEATFDSLPVLRVVEPQAAMDIGELLAKLNALDEDATGSQASRQVIFLGDGVSVYQEIIREKMAIPYMLAPANANRQRAGSIAALGEVYFRMGRTVSAAEHRPEYLRQSQAERELAEKENTCPRI